MKYWKYLIQLVNKKTLFQIVNAMFFNNIVIIYKSIFFYIIINIAFIY